ncbi:MAG: hypothetical protein HOP29_20315 [Phycisphaerales bacterium]|nr:hypothetical protein [Phycisphaerales bacterium]
MNKTVRKFSSHAEADAADREYYRGLTPRERLEVLLALVDQQLKEYDEASRRLQRVYRIVERPRR